VAIGGDPKGDIRSLILAQVNRIAVHTDSISVELRGPNGNSADRDGCSGQLVSLPWLKKPFQAEKGITQTPNAEHEASPISGEAVLAAVARARQWVDQLITGDSLADHWRQPC
jgi:hypothetical protein